MLDPTMLAHAFALAGEAMMVVTADGRLVVVNDEFTRSTGWKPPQVAGTMVTAMLEDTSHGSRLMESIDICLSTGERFSCEVCAYHANGNKRSYDAVITPLLLPNEPPHVVIVLPDPERRRHYDILTGLPDRAVFTERLRAACAQIDRSGKAAALLFIDLDGFKYVNDSLGHEAGDAVLKEAARRLKACVREMDTVCRLGGDEFTVLLTELTCGQDAEVAAKHILDRFAEPFPVSAQPPAISASIGIATLPEDGTVPEELMRKADAAMYKAKESGKATYCFYSNEIMARAMARLKQEHDLRHEFHAGHMEVHFQPIFEAASGRLAGAEALLRWNSPTHGIMNTAEFLSVAEASGMIVPLGDWVLERVVDNMIAWQKAGIPPLRLSANLSRRQLAEPSRLEHQLLRLKAAAIAPFVLDLEVTEAVFSDPSPATQAALKTLAGFDVGLTIDGFGANHVSLRNLQRLMVRSLKIDRLIVRQTPTKPEDSALVQTLITLAHTMGMIVIAEGVEGASQLDFLAHCGCDLVQGHLFSEALNEEAFFQFLLSQKELAASP